jgi:hypothetical protein
MTKFFIIIPLLFSFLNNRAQTDTDTTANCKSFKDYSVGEKTRLQGQMTAYRELYKSQQMTEALPIWQEIYTLAPGNNGKTKGFFDDGVNIYAAIMKTVSPTHQSKYADTIKMIHAKREVCFGIDGKYMGQKAWDYYFHIKPYVAEEENYSMFKKAIEMNNGRMDYFTVNPFMAMTKARLANGKEKAAEAGRLGYIAYQSMTEGQKTCTGNICESWKKVAEYSGKIIEEWETSGIAFPSNYYLDKYHSAYLASPQDCTITKMAFYKISNAKIDPNEPRYVEVKEAAGKCN